MNKEIYIGDLQNGDSFSDVFVINELKYLEDKNKNTYADITLGDKSGKLSGKIWSDSLAKLNKEILVEGELIEASGSVTEYRGNLQLNLKSVQEIDSKIDMNEFIRASDHSREELEERLVSYLDQIEETKIRKFIEKIIYDDEVKEKFFTYPAAKSIHHDFYHGLLHHVVEMLDIATSLRHFYKDVNFDIVIAGIIVHDIGKIEEFEYNGIQAELTRNYWLYGHIVLGLMLVRSYYDDDIDEEDLVQIEHIILSHHGEREYGSPVFPATPEAFIAAYADRLSFKLKTAMTVLEGTPDDAEMSGNAFFLDNVKIMNTIKRKKNLEPETKEEKDKEDTDQLSLV